MASFALNNLRRVLDRKPWAAHLYVTDRCNLDCHYCNEHDNGSPHPALDELRRRLRKIRELGVVRVGLQGGEPLMHPEIVEVVRSACELGFAPVSLATNALPLTEPLLRALEDAGLRRMNISVDRMTPGRGSHKALASVIGKLDWLRGSRVRLAVSGVLTEETTEEMGRVVDTCLERGIPVHARLVHDDLVAGRRLRGEGSTESFRRFLRREGQLKRQGRKIHTSWTVLEHQERLLSGEPAAWRCVAGYKYFFVSAKGRFWPCSQVRTERDILEIKLADLLAYDRPKSCQQHCGVYCTVDASHAVNRPLAYAWREARFRLAPWRAR